MPRDAKFDPAGKPRRRVLPCGSDHEPKSPVPQTIFHMLYLVAGK